MYKRILDIVLCSTVVLGFSSGAVASLTRADMSKTDRKQLVGILTKDPKTVLPEGAQLVEKTGQERPLPMLGHVTSSYWSPTLGRSIAMALIKGGRARKRPARKGWGLEEPGRTRPERESAPTSAAACAGKCTRAKNCQTG